MDIKSSASQDRRAGAGKKLNPPRRTQGNHENGNHKSASRQPREMNIAELGISRLPGADRSQSEEGLDKKTLLTALLAFKRGDFSVRLPIELEGMDGKIADAFNDVIELHDRMSKELDRLSRVVGKEGKISQRAS